MPHKDTAFYVQVIFLAVCVLLFVLFEVFVFQTLVDRVLPFQRESSLIIVLLLFPLLRLSTIIFDMMSLVIALRAGSQAADVFGAKVHKHFPDIPNAKQMEIRWAGRSRVSPRRTRSGILSLTRALMM